METIEVQTPLVQTPFEKPRDMCIHICSPPPTTRGNARLGAQVSTEPQIQKSQESKNVKFQKSKLVCKIP